MWHKKVALSNYLVVRILTPFFFFFHLAPNPFDHLMNRGEQQQVVQGVKKGKEDGLKLTQV